MKEAIKTFKSVTSYIREFDSLNDFEQYITNTPLNKVFQWKKLASVSSDYGFTHTHSYDEAVKLLKDGWQDKAQELTKKLSQYELTEIDSIEGDSKVKNGLMEFYPDADSVDEIVFDLFYKKK